MQDKTTTDAGGAAARGINQWNDYISTVDCASVTTRSDAIRSDAIRSMKSHERRAGRMNDEPREHVNGTLKERGRRACRTGSSAPLIADMCLKRVLSDTPESRLRLLCRVPRSTRLTRPLKTHAIRSESGPLLNWTPNVCGLVYCNV